VKENFITICVLNNFGNARRNTRYDFVIIYKFDDMAHKSYLLYSLSLSLSLSLLGYQESYSFLKKGYLGVLVFLGKGFAIAIPYLKAFM